MAALRGIGWAAGLFEGEGTVSIARRNTGRWKSEAGRCTPVLALKMTDEDVVMSFFRIMEIGYVAESEWYRQQGHKPQFRWSTKSQAEVSQAIRRLYPYMGVRRKKRMLDVLDLLDQKKKRRQELADEMRKHRKPVRGDGGKFVA